MNKIKTLKSYTLYTLLVAFIFYGCKQNSLEIGQTWVYTHKNPFANIKPKKQLIIDIKNGYVQYVENKTDTFSMSKRMFVIGAELKK